MNATDKAWSDVKTGRAISLVVLHCSGEGGACGKEVLWAFDTRPASPDPFVMSHRQIRQLRASKRKPFGEVMATDLIVLSEDVATIRTSCADHPPLAVDAQVLREHALRMRGKRAPERARVHKFGSTE